VQAVLPGTGNKADEDHATGILNVMNVTDKLAAPY